MVLEMYDIIHLENGFNVLFVMAQNLVFQLLKHLCLDDACKNTLCDKSHDDDLKFIVESVIEYYSQRHSLDPTLVGIVVTK